MEIGIFLIGLGCGIIVGGYMRRFIPMKVKAPDIGMKLPDQLFMKVECYNCGKENVAVLHVIDQTITNG